MCNKLNWYKLNWYKLNWYMCNKLTGMCNKLNIHCMLTLYNVGYIHAYIHKGLFRITV